MKPRSILTQAGIVAAFFILVLLLSYRLFSWGDSLTVLSEIAPRQLFPLLLMAAALGTDAMSLSIGIGMRGVSRKEVIRVSLVIGIFHVVMPLAGTVVGYYFGLIAGEIAHWTGAAIVAFIGGRMIWGCMSVNDSLSSRWTLSGLPLVMLAVSVSIDALSVGFGLGAFEYNIFLTSMVFGMFGGLMTAVGLMFGSSLGKIIGDRAELIGGIVLILLAVQMLFQG